MNPADREIRPISGTTLAALAGGILALAYPPFPLGFLAYGGMALAIGAVGLADHPLRVTTRVIAVRAWVFGTVFHVCTLYWVGWVSIPGMLTMAGILGLYVTAVVAVTAIAIRAFGGWALWLFPVVWTAHEYLRGFGALAFPWTNLSLSQVHYLPLIQYADITGDLGITFLAALLGVAIVRMVQALGRRPLWPALGYLLLIVVGIAAPLLYGHSALRRLHDADTVRIAVLQGDIDSDRKWEEGFTDRSLAVYEAQTRAAATRQAELIAWPETAAPLYLRADEEAYQSVRRLSAELRASLLVGTLEFRRRTGGRYDRYNAAVAVSNGHYAPDYHAKLQLVPFGEWIPFSDRIAALDKLEVGGAHFTAGDRYVLFDHPKGPYAAAVCFESAFPAIIRRFAQRGARFFVNITNDGWYGFSSGPPQHAAIATFRAIETRRPIARAANTGISGFVDRSGKYREPSRQYVPDIRLWDLGLGPRDATTFFVRHGMWCGQLCLAATIAVMTVAAGIGWRRIRIKRAQRV